MNKNIQEIEKEIIAINPTFSTELLGLIFEYVDLRYEQRQNGFVHDLSENKELQKELSKLTLQSK